MVDKCTQAYVSRYNYLDTFLLFIHRVSLSFRIDILSSHQAPYTMPYITRLNAIQLWFSFESTFALVSSRLVFQ